MVAPSVTLNREELYERVWRLPMWRIGDELGVNSSYIGKICRALKVPTPPAGYWTRRSTRTTEQNPPPPLPPIQRGELRSVLIRRTDGGDWTEAELQERQAMFEARRREVSEAAEIKEFAEARHMALIDMSRRSAEAEQLLRFLARLDGLTAGDRSSSVNEWLAWIRREAERLDPLSGGLDGVIAALEKASLAH